MYTSLKFKQNPLTSENHDFLENIKPRVHLWSYCEIQNQSANLIKTFYNFGTNWFILYTKNMTLDIIQYGIIDS